MNRAGARRRTRRCAWPALLALALAALGASAAPPAVRDAQTAPRMRDLAQRLLPVYQESRPERYLENLAALQSVAGEVDAAEATRRSLAKRRAGAAIDPARGTALLYDLVAHAHAVEAHERTPFERAFVQVFRATIHPLNDLDAYAVTGLPVPAPAPLEAALQAAFDERRGRGTLPLAEAVDLVWTYHAFEAMRRIGPLLPALDAEDDRRRYILDDRVLIRTDDGTRIGARLARPRNGAKVLPALLEFTIDSAGPNLLRESAAHGYAAVLAFTRGVGRPGAAPARPIVPFEHDGADARAVVEWIARQGWSDGRVAMLGDGYSGYVAWATAARAPAPLKAIATSSPLLPGIDFPMQGNIFQNAALRWLHGVAHPAPAAAASADDARWQALYATWYREGDPPADLDGLLGEPYPVLHRWLDHPAFDDYWQSLTPGREQLAHLGVPVLTISGYFAQAQGGALYLARALAEAQPGADQTLLLGPYDDGALRRAPDFALRSYELDAAARLDLRELRYQWLDAVLRGGARPAVLADRVNLETMGADAWRHAPTLAALEASSLRLHLDPRGRGPVRALAAEEVAGSGFARLNVDLAERQDAEWIGTPGLLGRTLPTRHALVFASEPLALPIEMGGALAGLLDFSVNKQDVDLTIALFEQMADGQTLQLFDPPYEFRASFLADRSRRRLLRAGVRQQLPFRAERASARLLRAGSRLVLVLGINKRPDQEINYGSGRDVGEEFVENAGAPLELHWFGGSYIDIPVHR
jgi:putative CocE/NonD family hydrolase